MKLKLRLRRNPNSFFYQTIDAMAEHNGLEMSGHIAFVMLLSLFPFIIFLAAVGGMVGRVMVGISQFGSPDLVGTFLTQSFQFLPPTITQTIVPVLVEILTVHSISLVSISAVIALWGASACVQAFRTSLNKAYHVRAKKRYFLMRRGQDMILVLIGTLMLLVLTFCIIISPLIIHYFGQYLPIPLDLLTKWAIWRYVVAGVLMVIFITAFHKLLPNRKLKIFDVLPGAIFSTIAWMVMASLFSLYFLHVNRYTLIYGSLAGFIITLIFFYLSALIFIIGAEINATFLNRKMAGQIIS